MRDSIEEIVPRTTTNYTWKQGTNNGVSTYSTTENIALDRVEGQKIAYLQQQIKIHESIIKSIDNALKILTENERNFIKYRYFENLTVEQTAQELGFSVQNCFRIRSNVMSKLIISCRNLLNPH
jgi:RNA polymerase sigma factor (sigma-70 family)